ncbi:MAG: S8 family peptidase [Bdellovibrionota bacterium]
MKKRLSLLCVCLIVYLTSNVASVFGKDFAKDDYFTRQSFTRESFTRESFEESNYQESNKLKVYPGYVVKFSNDKIEAKNTKQLFKSYNYRVQKSFKNYSLILPNKESIYSDDENNDKGFYLRTKEYNKNDNTCLELKKLGAIECSPNFEFKASMVAPNDPQYSKQWAFSNKGINAENDLEKLKGDKKTVVAVVDTGIDYYHPDLRDNLWVNPREIPNNGIDDDGNGVIDDVYGANFVDDTGSPLDDHGHGTHVAGIIGAKGNNGIGVAGTNWNVKIISVKFLNSYGSGSLYNGIRAFEYLEDLKNSGVDIKVVNNSWGGSSYVQSLFDAMDSLARKGVILTAAAGNEASDNDVLGTYPANFDIDNLVSVASTDEQGGISYFSNIGGSTVDIAAPGSHILSTYLNGQYASMSGTSMATPYVTGALSLLFSYNSSLSAKNAIERLYNTGRDESTLSGSVRTGRMVDISRLLYNNTTPLPEDPSCAYSVEKINYTSYNSAENSEIVMQSDEYPYYNLTLPFSFPFYGKNYSSAVISPNGVVYFGYTPTSFDFRNDSVAPKNSIAALHTDLIASSNPYGVRVSVEGDRATIYWRAKYYLRQFAGNVGDVYIKLVLHSSGVIENYVSFYDEDTLNAVSLKSTIGISGKDSSRTTYSYNSLGNITNNLAIRYVPTCTVPENLNVRSVNLYRVEKNKKFKRLKRAKIYAIELAGEGTGQVQARIGFEFGFCPDIVNIQVDNGRAVKNGTLRVPVNYARKLRIEVPKYNLKTAKNILSVKNNKKQYNRKRSKRQLNARCRRLMLNLQ